MPLHFACDQGHVEVVSLLLIAGALLDAKVKLLIR
jgi:ankyrin repeat protein